MGIIYFCLVGFPTNSPRSSAAGWKPRSLGFFLRKNPLVGRPGRVLSFGEFFFCLENSLGIGFLEGRRKQIEVQLLESQNSIFGSFLPVESVFLVSGSFITLKPLGFCNALKIYSCPLGVNPWGLRRYITT